MDHKTAALRTKVFVLYVHRKMTTRQVAEELGINQGRVQHHLKQLMQVSPRIHKMIRRQANAQRLSANASQINIKPRTRVFG